MAVFQEVSLFLGILSLVTISNVAGRLAARESYCAVSSQHTACRYTRTNQMGNCGPLKRLGLSAGEKKEIVDLHNSKRRLVAKGQQHGQPSAADMTKMVWDEEATAIAQLWAAQCMFAHDSKRETVQKGKEYNGQNLYWGGGYTEFNVSNAINAWYDEVKDFNPRTIAAFNGGGNAGHYTQMVWATSSRIGCGFVHHGNEMILACNYVPGGNIMGQPMYKTGHQCSACPANMSKCEDGLCSS